VVARARRFGGSTRLGRRVVRRSAEPDQTARSFFDATTARAMRATSRTSFFMRAV
jgi:hypothetical protein